MAGAWRDILIRVALVAAAALAPAAQAGTIALRRTATVEPGRPLVLADVAALDGDDASALAGVVIVEDPGGAWARGGWGEVRLEDVRSALREARARLSGLALSGGVCEVRVLAESPPAPAEARTAETQREQADAYAVIDPGGPPTARRAAAAMLSALLGVGWHDLRVRFDSSDAEFLDRTRHGQRVVVQPVSTPGSGRMALAVRVTEGDRLVESATVRASVETRRRVVVAREEIRRREEVSPSALEERDMWLPPGGSEPVGSVEEAAGSVSRSRIAPGAVVRRDLLESPVIVRRNELVHVHALRSGFEVRTRARARSDARRGDVIEFRVEGGKQSFRARVDGPGIAVVDLDARPDGAGAAEDGR